MPRSVLTPGSKKGASQALGISLEGVEEILSRVSKLSFRDAAFARGVKEVSRAAADVVAKEARDLVPVRSGTLKSGIFSAFGDPKKPDALAGVNYRKAPHAHLVEYGTSRTKAQPYMRPAIAATRGSVAVMVIDGFRRLLDKTIK